MNDTQPYELPDVANRADFLAGLAALGDELRTQIELDCAVFPSDAAASAARRARAQNDYQFFCTTYFPHYVPTPHFSVFQQYVFAQLPKAIDGAGDKTDARCVLMAPRGEAKSTYCTQLGTLWCIVTGRKNMIGLLMNTEEQAAEMLESIKAELDSNPRLGMDFAQATGKGRVWQATTIITVNNVKVRIGGTGKKIRGMKHGPYRPDLIFLDDLENDEQVRQKAQRDKTEKYVLSAVLGLAPPAGGMDVFWVGTSLHYDAAINRVGRSPGWRMAVFKSIMTWPNRMDLWEQWEAKYTQPNTQISLGAEAQGESLALTFYLENQTQMNQGALVSWPDVRPLYRLMCMRAVSHDAFSQEQQNEAGNDDNAPFKEVQFWVNKLPSWIFFGAIDPSLGKHGSARDPSAILVGGLNRDTMTLDVVEADIARLVPDLIIDRAIELHAQYHCVAWAVETVQFQAFMYTELIKRAALRGLSFPGIPVTPSTDKSLRIQSLQPAIKNGQIRLHCSQSTLISQLKFWPESDHDDGPDALEMLYSIARQFAAPMEYTAVPRQGMGAGYRGRHLGRVSSSQAWRGADVPTDFTNFWQEDEDQ